MGGKLRNRHSEHYRHRWRHTYRVREKDLELSLGKAFWRMPKHMLCVISALQQNQEGR